MAQALAFPRMARPAEAAAVPLDFSRYAAAAPRSALGRPVVHTPDPAELSAWVVVFACMHLIWTVLWCSWRHWLAMLGYRLRARLARAAHSLRVAYCVGACGWALAAAGWGALFFVLFMWR